MSFNPGIAIIKTDQGKADWYVVAQDTPVGHPVRPYVIERGYVTDLISAPWVVYPLIHPHGSGANEAIMHDWEHDNNYLQGELGGERARQLSNLMFAARMVCGRVPIWKVWLMLLWVSALSWVTWRKPKR